MRLKFWQRDEPDDDALADEVDLREMYGHYPEDEFDDEEAGV